MTPLSRFRWGMAAIAAGVILTLMLLPSTGWIARQEIAYQLFPWAGLMAGVGVCGDWTTRVGAGLAEKRREAAMDRTAAAHPDDVQIQMASALRKVRDEWTPESLARQVIALQPLLERFPASPSLHATLIRFLSGSVQSIRPEGDRLAGLSPPAPAYSPLTGEGRRTAELLAEYSRAGARLEPANAFFPTMGAVAALALRHDAQAFADLSRAAAGSRWHDYAEDEPQGRMRLREAAFGPQPAITKLAISMAVQLPNYTRVRALARDATYLAMKKEQAGDVKGGLRARMELVRVGSLMRAEPSSVIGSLVGIAMESIATERPGGSRMLDSPGDGDAKAVERQRIGRFLAWAREHGSPEQAGWLQAEFDRAAVTRTTLDEEFKEDPFLGPSLRATVLRYADWALLAAAFWTALMALGVSVGRRARSDVCQGGQGVAFLWTLAYLLAAWALMVVLISQATAALGPVVIGVALVMFAGVWWPVRAVLMHGWPEGVQRLKVWPAAAALVAVLVLWQLPALLAEPGFFGMVRELSGPPEGGTPPLEVLPPLLPLLVPLALLLILALAAALRREPASTGAVRLLSVTAMPIIAALLVCYAVSVVQTSRAEKQASAAIAGMLSGEGKYAAGLIGKPWPGPAPEIP